MVDVLEPKVQNLKQEALQSLRVLKSKLAEIERLTGEAEIVNLGRFIGEVWIHSEPQTPVDRRFQEAIDRGEPGRQKLKSAEGGSLSADEAAQKLGMSKVAILKRLKAGRLLAWREERQNAYRFPAWQFEANAVLPGLERVLSILQSSRMLDESGLLFFFLSKSRFLNGRRPLDLLREGRVHQVIQAAEGYGR